MCVCVGSGGEEGGRWISVWSLNHFLSHHNNRQQPFKILQRSPLPKEWHFRDSHCTLHKYRFIFHFLTLSTFWRFQRPNKPSPFTASAFYIPVKATFSGIVSAWQIISVVNTVGGPLWLLRLIVQSCWRAFSSDGPCTLSGLGVERQDSLGLPGTQWVLWGWAEEHCTPCFHADGRSRSLDVDECP
jgi:hypothetical protein